MGLAARRVFRVRFWDCSDGMGAVPMRQVLIEFALWFSNTWEANNEDDREEAAEAVDAFLEGVLR